MCITCQQKEMGMNLKMQASNYSVFKLILVGF